MNTAPQKTGAAGAIDERRKQPLASAVETALTRYLKDLDGDMPANLYEMVLCEVEQPLLRSVMQFTRGNQSLAAQILGLNRSTLRKKLAKYGLGR
ncbi:MAG: DNA-binding transcriptional regulator Fis [Gammaproteobacteria bacterium]|nr:DNA-binding transcriptional regulator Fis [Gammaproteobacteria bacterium]